MIRHKLAVIAALLIGPMNTFAQMQLATTWSYADCAGNIAIDLTVSNGIGPYAYHFWSPALGNSFNYTSGEDISVPFGGTYNVHVSDLGDPQFNNYYASATATFTVGMSAIVTTSACLGVGTGSIDVTPSGDLTPPLQFVWYGPSGYTATSEDISGLMAGTYRVDIEDVNGCVRRAVFNVQGDALTLNHSVGPHAYDCDPPAGSIDLDVFGGTPPYTFQWSSGQVTQDIQNVIPSFYWVRATDANGCSVISDWIQVPWDRNIAVTAQVTPTCLFGSLGAIDISVNGGTPPYSYDWWEVGGFTATSEDISGLVDGVYYLNITDANECFAQNFFTVSIDWSALQLSAQITNSPSCGLGGAIDLTVTGGTGPYQYYWWYSGGIATEDLSGIPAGSYNVQVTDQNGCMAFAEYVVDGMRWSAKTGQEEGTS